MTTCMIHPCKSEVLLYSRTFYKHIIATVWKSSIPTHSSIRLEKEKKYKEAETAVRKGIFRTKNSSSQINVEDDVPTAITTLCHVICKTLKVLSGYFTLLH